ncbi:hypothetical protein [Chryseobacterium sp. FH1]|uniref:hypothetical protein n=1 Tax=Chryseobacterium sp. FH1 TaxID=1233951 RepID=UPI0004E2BA7E|nr:hypothetical protein [Chryseobacterium sp. FH1]KFC18252.1 hypothetical protein IO90_18710 [Chryseobacterium sp. FH1]
MKKIFTVLTFSLVSLVFTSCREDSMEAEIENAIPQSRKAPNSKATDSKFTDSIVADTIKTNTANTANKEELDPEKDPPRDRTRW